MPSPDPQPREPIDFIYRFNPGNPKPLFVPRDWEDAAVYLQAGNVLTGRFYESCRHGAIRPDARPAVIEISGSGVVGTDGLPIQMPFAAMIGCSDARVPTELLFGQEFNDIFNIRVAGNVLVDSVVGSLLYAIRTFSPEPEHPEARSLRLAGVLGHRGCGAVRATVRTFTAGPTAASVFADPIGTLVAKIAAPPLSTAAELLDARHGTGASMQARFEAELIELVVYLNAAWTANGVCEWIEAEGPETVSRVGVVYGVFDPMNWRVNSLPATPSDPAPASFGAPPRSAKALRALGEIILDRLAEASP